MQNKGDAERYERYCMAIEEAITRYDRDGDGQALEDTMQDAARYRPSPGWMFDPSNEDTMIQIGNRVRERLGR